MSTQNTETNRRQAGVLFACSIYLSLMPEQFFDLVSSPGREIFLLFGEKNHFFCYSLKSAWKIRKTCSNHKTCFSDIRAEAGITLTDDCGNLLPDENHNLERSKELNRVRVTDKRLNFFVAIHCNLNTTKFTKILILIIPRTDTKPHLAIDICQ